VNVAQGLSLAAAPTFAVMAAVSAIAGGPAAVLCSAEPASPLTGMTTMYTLMAAFHVSPWLKRWTSER
jgi:hypothetical protein